MGLFMLLSEKLLLSQIADNAKELVAALIRLKPSSAKGSYVKSIVLSSTMSPGVKVEPKSISV